MDKLSQFFTKTIRENPQGEEAINAKFLIRGGFIAKQMAGVYTLLPLGLKVVTKINNIIRQELNSIGAQEILMPALQSMELWQKTGRWQTENKVMYQFKDNSAKDIGLGWTHEEVVTEIATQFIQSYKDLPRAVYQIQTKFRDEPRARSGILRGREFLMKDLYSFHIGRSDRDKYYQQVKSAYYNIFNKIGLSAIETNASGGAFSKYSHEFQVIADSGEDAVFVCENCQHGYNQEIVEEISKPKFQISNKFQNQNFKSKIYHCPKCEGGLIGKRAIEVGNIFKLGTRFSEDLGLFVADDTGKRVAVEMACYGIGPTRVMGTIVEVSHDEKGIIWGKNVAPYDATIVELRIKNYELRKETKEIIEQLEKAGLEVLLDDREDVSVGEKLADADLIGIPWRVVISDKSIAGGGVEIKKRDSEKVEIIDIAQAVSIINN